MGCIDVGWKFLHAAIIKVAKNSKINNGQPVFVTHELRGLYKTKSHFVTFFCHVRFCDNKAMLYACDNKYTNAT